MLALPQSSMQLGKMDAALSEDPRWWYMPQTLDCHGIFTRRTSCGVLRSLSIVEIPELCTITRHQLVRFTA